MMKKRRRIRFPPKINDDTMSSIVIYSLLFCAAITIAGMVLGAFDHAVNPLVCGFRAVQCLLHHFFYCVHAVIPFLNSAPVPL